MLTATISRPLFPGNKRRPRADRPPYSHCINSHDPALFPQAKPTVFSRNIGDSPSPIFPYFRLNGRSQLIVFTVSGNSRSAAYILGSRIDHRARVMLPKVE